MANIKITIRNEDFIIDIPTTNCAYVNCESRCFERVDFERKHSRVYPLPCQRIPIPYQQRRSIEKLQLKRSYKAICIDCESITSTYNKNRIALCPGCERKQTKLRAVCYKCDNITSMFKKDKHGFVCIDCIDDYNKVKSYCPICEYEVYTKDRDVCDQCKEGVIRQPRIIRETRVLCCNCEQVAIQLNPNNSKVYCNECKNDLFMNPV